MPNVPKERMMESKEGEGVMKLWTKEWFAEINEKAARSHRTQDVKKQLFNRLDSEVQRPLSIPLTGGGWYHRYVCPKDGTRLTYKARDRHLCPKCGAVWSGSPWDECGVDLEHRRYAELARDAAIGYALKGESAWSQLAKSIVLFYAEHYERYPLHDKNSGAGKTSGKVHCQTLTEASWIVPIAHSYHILKEHGQWTAAEEEHCRRGLFHKVPPLLRQNRMGISNWQSYHNAALAAIAAAIHDEELMHEAIYDGNNGFLFQMEHSLDEDGFWYEGAWGYHLYALYAHVQLVMAADTFDMDLKNHPRFKKMFEIPLLAAMPDGTLPAVHDSEKVNLTGRAALYECAYAWWGLGTDLLSLSRRDSLYSLLFGKDLDRAAPANTHDQKIVEEQQSISAIHLKKTGMIVLKENGSRPRALLLDYGQHGGEHGHFDKLHYSFFSDGKEWVTDAGMLPYGHPLHYSWFRHTIAHNGIVINGASQRPTEGQLTVNEYRNGAYMLQAESSEAYQGVKLRRTLFLESRFLLDICEARSEVPVTMDCFLHLEGEPESADLIRLGGEPAEGLAGADGYSHLQNGIRLADWQRSWLIRWRSGSGTEHPLRMWGIEEAPGVQSYMYDTPAMPSIGHRKTLVRRQQAVTYGRFITGFSREQQDMEEVLTWLQHRLPIN